MKAIFQLTIIAILALGGDSFASEKATTRSECRAYLVVEPRFGTRDWVDVEIVEQSTDSFKNCPSFVMIDKWNVYTLTSVNLRQCIYEHKDLELYCEKEE